MSRLHHTSLVRHAPLQEAHVVEVVSRTGERDRLRVLDACLHALENAHEHNMLTVTPALADTLRAQVSGIRAGMTIADAIEVVLREQEPCLRWRREQRRPLVSDGAASDPRACEDDLHGEQDGSGSHARSMEVRPAAHGLTVGQSLGPPLTAGQTRSVSPLDEVAARSLTERIKHAVGNTCLLLLEAHSRRAWSALGYMTWEQYVREEFGLSRSRSYELLDHGRLIRTIEVAAGVSGIADISTFAARRLKPRLHEIAAEVRHRTADAPQDQVAGIVARVIGEERARLAPSASVAADDGTLNGQARRSGHHHELSSLYDAIDTLAEMPSVEDTLARIPPDHRRRLAPVNAAAAWLAELAEGLKASQPAQWRDTPAT